MTQIRTHTHTNRYAVRDASQQCIGPERCSDHIVLDATIQGQTGVPGEPLDLKEIVSRDRAAAAQTDVERSSISTTDTALIDTADELRHRKKVLEWFEAELKNVMENPSAAEAITACVEVIISDDMTSREEVAESVLDVASAEDVPEELALELLHRW